MIPDNEGFLYPEIVNKEKCTGCNLCERICPLTKIKAATATAKYPKTYALINNDEQVRLKSSSGGAFSVLAGGLIRQNGVVFGAKFAADFSVIHDCAGNLAELYPMRGSKYTQSAIGENYIRCKKYLNEGRKVLFSGTPCQIEGLKSYLQKEYDNLLCVDFLCHGVPSPKVWKKYLDYQEFKTGLKPEEIYFRGKIFGWSKISMHIKYPNNQQYLKYAYRDLFYRAFLKHICLRKCCYQCGYVTLNRVSDISMADFWGVDTICPEMFDDKGTSLIMIHSDKGNRVLGDIENKCTIKPVDTDIAVRFNRIGNHTIPENRDKYFQYLDLLSFTALDRRYVKEKFAVRLYGFLRRHLDTIGISFFK
jgi:coenzyme F420-reducing hydrogenase beta subunit